MTADLFDRSVESLLSSGIGSSFTVNGRMQCKLDEAFSAWDDDVNSSSKFSEAHVIVAFDDKAFDGLVSVQRDALLSQKYYVTLYLKDKAFVHWQHMFTVVDIKS